MCDHTPYLAGCIRGFPTSVPWLRMDIACMIATSVDNLSVIALVKDGSSSGIQKIVSTNLSTQALVHVDQTNRCWLMFPLQW